ncbi:MAG TPA: aminotransferase class V-fold PLP-dependent enzyme [Cyclobacteriaceae bacterium]|nr:aminotransferase class V-fold PLP-dependent enzyme [Cyclobacteriaceae bacterium]
MLSLQRSKFSLPKSITYLNCAYMSPLLKKVEKAGIEGIKGKRNPIHISPKEFFTSGELLRKQFAKLVGSKDPKRIAIIPSASYGMANAAHNIKLRSSEKVIVMGEQFPSNYYPWQRLCLDSGARLETIAPPQTRVNRGKVWNERILDAIDNNTRIVAMGHVHWADGTLYNLKEIRKRTLEVGALLLIDATQSVGALPFNIQSIQPDVLVCAGYKWMMGPYSIGLAYYGPYFDNGTPIEENWINRLNSEDFAGLVNYEVAYQPGALRYEVGEHSNFILAPMMLEALQQINEWKPKNIQEYCAKISKRPIELLRENGFWIEDDQYRANHLFGVRLPEGKDIKTVKAKLKKKNISVSYRGDAIRVSPHVYNQEKELMNFARVLIE